MKMSNLGYPPKRTLPGINWRKAAQAGLFTDLDVLQADRQLAKSKKNAELRQAKEDAAPTIRRNDDPTVTTIRNAVFTRRS